MENRDIGAFLELLLDFKASRSGDILQVDAAEGTGDKGDGLHDFVYIVCFYADRNGIDIAKSLEQRAFSFHNRHSGFRADISQTENGCSVGYYCDGVPSSGQLIAFIDIFLNLQTGLCNAGSVSETQCLSTVYVGSQLDFDFTLPLIVLFQGFLCVIHFVFLHI